MPREVIYNPDHLQGALDVLLSQYREGDRIMALVGALVAGIQEMEDTTFDVLVGTPLTVAGGGTLDQWGLVLDEAREGMDDNAYRDVLFAKLAALRSNGSVPDVLKVWLLLNPDVTSAIFTATYPAAYRLEVEHTTLYDDTTRARILRIMEGVRPAGVLAEYVEGEEDCFIFDTELRGFDLAPMANRWT
jgi:hypothetical protein